MGCRGMPQSPCREAILSLSSGPQYSWTARRQYNVATAPLNLIYVADTSKTGSAPDSELYTGADAGFISQNVYLFCASENLATVARGGVDRAALAKAMKLRPEQRIILAQTVGYPKK